MDETEHQILMCKIVNTTSSVNKKYKENLLKEVITSICAMLNSIGGNVVLYNKCSCQLATSWFYFFIRILEQTLISILGSNQTVSHINFKDEKDRVVVAVNKADSLITTNYNLYLPSQTQVVQVYAWELDKVKSHILKRKYVREPVQLYSHSKEFFKDKNCGFHETKVIMSKNLKAEESKRTRLADRMTGKGNKFNCYVSGFANYWGGHMYYGIKDDGIVEGEYISNENVNDITKKVDKALNKLIWPEEIGQPKRGEHWQIFFEPVLDKNSNPIPSTFVIVIYVAPCLGGVFTEEPECYEMVEGKVQKMSFITWKKRVCFSDGIPIPPTIKRIGWSSSATERRCMKVDEVLTMTINNGNWNLFTKLAKSLEGKANEVDVKLVISSKRVTACYRRGYFNKARIELNNYEKQMSKANDPLIFQVIYLYLKAALKRLKREFEESELFLHEALTMVDQLPRGIVPAAILSSAAMHPGSNSLSPDVLCTKVLQHLSYAQISRTREELEHKAFIILATFHLGYDISGKMFEKNANKSSFDTGKSSVMKLKKSICDGCPLSRYREVQFNLVQSMLYYRYSQMSKEKKKIFLEEAIHFSKKAQYLAKTFKFDEIIIWANISVALCTEALILASLEETDKVSKIVKILGLPNMYLN